MERPFFSYIKREAKNAVLQGHKDIMSFVISETIKETAKIALLKAESVSVSKYPTSKEASAAANMAHEIYEAILESSEDWK